MAYTKKDTGISDLKQQIKEDRLKPYYLFYGSEVYLKEEYVKRIRAKVPDNGFEEFNYIVLNGRDIPLSDYDDVLESPPMMAERKLVYIKDSGIFKSAKEAQITFWKEKLSRVSDDMIVIFNEDSIDKRGTIYKTFKTNGQDIEFKTPSESDLVTYIMGLCLKAKKRIKKEDAYKIIERCDEGMQNIVNELNKLFDYCDEQITQYDIEAVVAKGLSVKIFELTDSMAMQNSDTAMKILADLRNSNEKTFQILYLVHSNLKKILQVKLSGNFDSRAVARMIGVPDFATKKFIFAAQKYKTETLERLLVRIPEIDYQIKTGNINEWIALEQFIADAMFLK